MASLSQLEQEIAQLPRDEQLWLIERLIHRLRNETPAQKAAMENELKAMAADPDIQSELRAIEAEFRFTERDGLEDS